MDDAATVASDATLRREFAARMKERGCSEVVRNAPVERLESVLQELQARGEITLRRHDGQVVLIWGRV